jgi:hypothetical protein
VSAQPSEDRRLAELDDGAIWAWWCRESAEQGLAPDIEPALIQRVAELALVGSNKTLALGPGLPSGNANRNGEGPGITNRDLRNTTSHTTEEVVGA